MAVPPPSTMAAPTADASATVRVSRTGELAPDSGVALDDDHLVAALAEQGREQLTDGPVADDGHVIAAGHGHPQASFAAVNR